MTPVNMDTESCQSNADSAVINLEDGLTYFVKPFELVRILSSKLYFFQTVPLVTLE